MSPKFIAALAAALAFAVPVAAQTVSETQQSARNVEAHITFLASDLLEGREAGSKGFDIAAEYVASQFRQLGLRPMGDNGTYFQRVPLLAYRPADKGKVSVRGASLKFGEDYLPRANAAAAQTKVSGELVFVGYGVQVGERDDYAGLDVRGKIVVVLNGAPAFLQSEERAYHASSRTKREIAARHGAVGYIGLYTPEDERAYPFADGVRDWQAWSMTWRQADDTAFITTPQVPALLTVSVKGAAKLFDGAAASFADVAAAATQPTANPPRFALGKSLSFTGRTEMRKIEGRNVVAMLEGGDPSLKRETVVLSAHLDHIGLVAPVNGDAIANGALDNAAGVATTIEAARLFRQAPVGARRSIVFLTVTAEEKGLVGADYFARNPTVPAGSIVANVDLDMPILTYNFTDVVAFGAERSSIGPAVQRAAKRMGVSLSPDPIPEEGVFTRSDHYRFVEQGIPAVFLMTGFAGGGEAQSKAFWAGRYHKPSDDLSQAIDFGAGAKFARLNYEIARELADLDEAPAWNKGDFFGEKYGKR